MPRFLSSVILAAHLVAGASVPQGAVNVEYNRHVRPILGDHCFMCHGFDPKTREAGLRLDTREGATALNEGRRAIVPGKPLESELWKRITHADPDEVMPPTKHPKSLTDAHRDTLRRWIEQGAEYQDHWAYIPIRKPAVPDARQEGFSRSPIDAFVLEHHRSERVAPTAEADRRMLARRLCLDLLGLPPTPAQLDAFAADPRPDAYERLVDELLASPHYGERMAAWWLDQVRYADSAGYHSDNPRNVWPYRDHVTRVFKCNQPFDRFVTEQLAGDLLPNPTTGMKVASAYNRLILSTEEGGAQAREYEAKHVTDRVKSIGTTFLGQTFMCAECHDHKYDPIATRDFYSMGAFFADIQESTLGRREPGMVVASPEQESRLAELKASVEAVEAEMKTAAAALAAEQVAWEESLRARLDAATAWEVVAPSSAVSKGGNSLVVEGDRLRIADATKADRDVMAVTYRTTAPRVSGLRLEVLKNGNGATGLSGNGNIVLSEITLELEDATGKRTPVPFSHASATHEQGGFPAAEAIDGNISGGENGWALLNEQKREQSLYLELAKPLEQAGEKILVLTRHELWGDRHLAGNTRLSLTGAPGPVRAPGAELAPKDVLAALRVNSTERTPAQHEALAAHYRSQAPALAAFRERKAGAKKDSTSSKRPSDVASSPAVATRARCAFCRAATGRTPAVKSSFPPPPPTCPATASPRPPTA